jgi:hypothetical protein
MITAKGNDQVAIGMLLGILGSSEENYTRAAMTIAKAKAVKEFGQINDIS